MNEKEHTEELAAETESYASWLGRTVRTTNELVTRSYDVAYGVNAAKSDYDFIVEDAKSLGNLLTSAPDADGFIDKAKALGDTIRFAPSHVARVKRNAEQLVFAVRSRLPEKIKGIAEIAKSLQSVGPYSNESVELARQIARGGDSLRDESEKMDGLITTIQSDLNYVLEAIEPGIVQERLPTVTPLEEAVQEFMLLPERIDALDGIVSGYTEGEHTIENKVTEYPVESGFIASDHTQNLPKTVTLTGWASKLAANKGDATTAWEAIVKLMEEGTLVKLATPLHVYDNMVIRSASAPFNKDLGRSLRFEITLQEIRGVDVKYQPTGNANLDQDAKNTEDRLAENKLGTLPPKSVKVRNVSTVPNLDLGEVSPEQLKSAGFHPSDPNYYIAEIVLPTETGAAFNYDTIIEGQKYNIDVRWTPMEVVKEYGPISLTTEFGELAVEGVVDQERREAGWYLTMWKYTGNERELLIGSKRINSNSTVVPQHIMDNLGRIVCEAVPTSGFFSWLFGSGDTAELTRDSWDDNTHRLVYYGVRAPLGAKKLNIDAAIEG